jgi:hypothetical protein
MVLDIRQGTEYQASYEGYTRCSYRHRPNISQLSRLLCPDNHQGKLKDSEHRNCDEFGEFEGSASNGRGESAQVSQTRRGCNEQDCGRTNGKEVLLEGNSEIEVVATRLYDRTEGSVRRWGTPKGGGGVAHTGRVAMRKVRKQWERHTPEIEVVVELA